MSPSMTGRTLARAAALTLTLSLPVGLSAAGEGPREDNDAKALQAGPTRTGKERLGGKASDEQRVDNCKVPLDRRGATPRPDTCRHDVSTGSTR
jgi:hypothetical protein